MKVFDLEEGSSLRRAVLSAAEFLSAHGVEEARNDAMLLLEYATGYSRNKYFMHRDEKMAASERESFSKSVTARSLRIPLQHITGEAYFYGRRFIVNSNVLIPRADTEILVEEVLKDAHGKMEVLDLCTGSGCIAVTISKEAGIKTVGSDISCAALSVAKKNADLHEADCVFIQSDMFDDIASKFDVIVSNPPYIKSGEIQMLQEEVKRHDPHLALDGGEDGLDFYRIIAKNCVKHLKPKGRLYLEIGSDQAEEVSVLLSVSGFFNISVVKDLNHLPRVVRAEIK